jgi:hypothetical protein
MTKKSNEAVEATVVENNSTPVVTKTPVEVLTAQQDNFRKQLEVAKSNMAKLQQQFEAQKILATKLEGALEGLQLLADSLKK